MDSNKLNISKIETYLNSIFDGTVSDNTFFGGKPEESIVKASNWGDMCVIELPNGVQDHDAYGKGTVLVWLYAKPLESGKKNVATMSQLETNLNSVIKGVTDKTYHIHRRLTYTAYDNEIDWHCNVVELIIKVF